jgi:polyhydroxybutyrate depolymerase
VLNVRRLAIWSVLTVVTAAVLAPKAASAGAADQLPQGDHQFSIDFGGGAREYLVHVPSGARPETRLPVVFNFHGGGSDAPAQKAYSQMDATADRHVVYPQGAPTRARPRHGSRTRRASMTRRSCSGSSRAPGTCGRGRPLT